MNYISQSWSLIY